MADTYLIQKKGYVGNSLLWWRKNDYGYTINLEEAKEFTQFEAEEIIKSSGSDKTMHLKYDVINAAELHLNSESIEWHNYLKKKP